MFFDVSEVRVRRASHAGSIHGLVAPGIDADHLSKGAMSL